MKQDRIRNLAIIAHVDHGKTTLVDGMLKQSGVFHERQVVEDRVMDRNDLERERGITIMAKNTAIIYKDYRFNIVDTPGHSDFGGEVERIVQMVNGVLLLVDASEGPMPQTRFVLKKALASGLYPIVVINKIDRPQARPVEVLDEVLDLFIELEASDEQLDFPVIYTNARTGTASLDPAISGDNLMALFEMIIAKIPAPEGDPEQPLQVGVSMIDYDTYVGRQAVGRVSNGSLRVRQEVVVASIDGAGNRQRIAGLYIFDGLKKVPVEEAGIGEIVVITGLDGFNVGDTVCEPEQAHMLDFVPIDEPTVAIGIQVNKSPFSGREGTYVTSRKLGERLIRELESDVSLRVTPTASPDTFIVSGRGELHLSILIETMRREGYEFEVSRPQIIERYIDGQRCEPIEELVIEVPEEYVGVVMEGLGSRKSEMVNMTQKNEGFMYMEFLVPTRGLFGFRSQFLTDTRGMGTMHHLLHGYAPHRGEIDTRQRGSVVAHEHGETTAYGLENAQERGELFVAAGTPVYRGMIVGENSRPGDLVVNVCKKKHLTNVRSSSSDMAIKLSPPRTMNLEQCLEFIADDELVEITPLTIRMRKVAMS
ncbi:MAG: translational GTPase TypA [Syntrophomonadaceae bacterium]|nr:translational GTPase TypA [Syntrophomonadaceae bacterium]MDD3022998.1 translational GTPase TypA [Syntrophomonadaceae bacterium]